MSGSIWAPAFFPKLYEIWKPYCCAQLRVMKSTQGRFLSLTLNQLRPSCLCGANVASPPVVWDSSSSSLGSGWSCKTTKSDILYLKLPSAAWELLLCIFLPGKKAVGQEVNCSEFPLLFFQLQHPIVYKRYPHLGGSARPRANSYCALRLL